MKAARKPDLAADAPPRPGGAFSPEVLAQRAVARKPTTPSGHRVKLVLTLFLPQSPTGQP